MNVTIITITSVVLFGFAALSVRAARRWEPSSEAIQHCAKLLRESGTDPKERKLSVTRYSTATAYFRSKPHDDYWDAGRRAIGKRAFYTVSFMPKRPMLGGITVYFLDANTHRILWTYRGV